MSELELLLTLSMRLCDTRYLGGRVSHIANAISELQHQKDAIDRALASLRAIAASGTKVALNIPAGVSPTKSRISAKGRRRIGEAAKKRWAAFRAAKDGAATTKAAPVDKKAAPAKKAKKRVLSAEARKKMAEAAKKRWAAEKKKTA
jgi:hypothetical protein